ncbi:MAG: hypothetical protein AB7F25_02875 [Deferribacterales bacterium]
MVHRLSGVFPGVTPSAFAIHQNPVFAVNGNVTDVAAAHCVIRLPRSPISVIEQSTVTPLKTRVAC